MQSHLSLTQSPLPPPSSSLLPLPLPSPLFPPLICLSGSEEADGIEVLHRLPPLVRYELKQVDFLLQDLGLGVDHAHDTDLRGRESGGRGEGGNLGKVEREKVCVWGGGG